jgi:hypothetical protein
MANFRKPAGADDAGFDADRSMQVIPVGRIARLYLIAGDGMEVAIDDTSIASVTIDPSDNPRAHSNSALTGWEKTQSIRELRVRGLTLGSTQLHGTLNGNEWANPVNIVVVNDPEARRVGGAATVSPDIQQTIATSTLRDAVLLVAEDQMNSAVSRGDGFGVYDVDPSYDWCGAFAHWCWKLAAAIQGVDSPFGTNNDKLLSPQKAISWAMRDDTPAQLLRYHGYDPFRGGDAVQEYREIGYNGYDLERGDVVLLRKGTANGWKHVCMVYSWDGTNLTTMDGNQGWPRSIKTVSREINEKLSDVSYTLVFVHPIF